MRASSSGRDWMDVRKEALADSGKGLIVLPPHELKRTGSHSWPERRRSEDGEVDWACGCSLHWGRDGGLPSGWVDWLVGFGWVQHPSGRREELGWAGLWSLGPVLGAPRPGYLTSWGRALHHAAAPCEHQVPAPGLG